MSGVLTRPVINRQDNFFHLLHTGIDLKTADVITDIMHTLTSQIKSHMQHPMHDVIGKICSFQTNLLQGIVSPKG